MNLPDILAILSGAAVGLVLAVIGGGGSILATPALLYVVGIANPHMAIGTSAIAVSINAFANLINHARRGHVQWRCAVTFAGAGVAGAAIGAEIGKRTDAHVLLPLFAVLMIVVGFFMLRPRQHDGAGEVELTRKVTDAEFLGHTEHTKNRAGPAPAPTRQQPWHGIHTMHD